MISIQCRSGDSNILLPPFTLCNLLNPKKQQQRMNGKDAEVARDTTREMTFDL